MGCGNSSPASTTTNSSSSTAGRDESSSKASDDPVPEDDKWKNYGESDKDSLRRPLWGNGL